LEIECSSIFPVAPLHFQKNTKISVQLIAGFDRKVKQTDSLSSMNLTTPLTYRPATPADWSAFAALLSLADLPRAGADRHLADFLMAVHGDAALAGVVGLEVYGGTALLRSVVAADRGQGLGRTLVQETLAAARARGIRQVVLLTTIAADFFPRFGFRHIERSAAPPSCRHRANFRTRARPLRR
jgi:N-acetylglutamate synthase-like GNAT family acetyltransferase